MTTQSSQQVLSAITPAETRSPMSKVKRDHSVLKASLEASVKKQRQLKAIGERDKNKIIILKAHNNQSMRDIMHKCRASNVNIKEALFEARELTASALKMISEAHSKCAAAKERVIAECTHPNDKICKERESHSRECSRLRQKLDEKLKKLDQEQDAAVNLDRNKFEKKYNKVKIQIEAASQKLKGQRKTW
jgi:hypothetical protein